MAGGRLTARDLTVLGWIGRWRGVTSPQIARQHDMPLKVVERRMRVLTGLGLVDGATLLAGVPRVHWLTRAGMTAAGLEGSVVSPKVAELLHDLEVVELSHHLATIQPTFAQITEREIRAAEPNPASGPAAAVRSDLEVGVGRGTGGRGFPDLATVTDDGQVWVHELERSRKDTPRLVRLMWSYQHARHIAGAVYWAVPAAHAAVQRAAEESNRQTEAAGAQPCIVAQEWTPRLG